MPRRPCLDCGTITDTTRCATCRSTKDRQRDQQRGTRQDRGYDAQYDRLHADWQRRLDAGEPVPCWRCDEAGTPHLVDPRDWHLGHDQADRSVIRGPQCPSTNLRDAGAAAHARTRS